MNCPACNVALAMADRQGVEIDYCPRCRGVWLDRGEIDKIVAREVAAYGPLSQGVSSPAVPEGPFYRDEREERAGRGAPYHEGDRDDDRRGADRHYDDKSRKKQKRESFLEELFDFG